MIPTPRPGALERAKHLEPTGGEVGLGPEPVEHDARSFGEQQLQRIRVARTALPD